MSKYTKEGAIKQLESNGIEVSTTKKLIHIKPGKPPGIKMLGIIDYLCNFHKFMRGGE